jgi:hypothetical protein
MLTAGQVKGRRGRFNPRKAVQLGGFEQFRMILEEPAGQLCVRTRHVGISPEDRPNDVRKISPVTRFRDEFE